MFRLKFWWEKLICVFIFTSETSEKILISTFEELIFYTKCKRKRDLARVFLHCIDKVVFPQIRGALEKSFLAQSFIQASINGFSSGSLWIFLKIILDKGLLPPWVIIYVPQYQFDFLNKLYFSNEIHTYLISYRQAKSNPEEHVKLILMNLFEQENIEIDKDSISLHIFTSK